MRSALPNNNNINFIIVGLFDYVGVCFLIVEAITDVVLKKIINLPALSIQSGRLHAAAYNG